MIGLRSALKNCEGSSLWYKVKHLAYEIKIAWSRAWRGYDDTMWFSLDYHFVETYTVLITELRENLHGHPCDMTMEEWEGTLDKMLLLLSAMTDDDFDYEWQEDAKNEFFKLFSEHFYNLWD